VRYRTDWGNCEGYLRYQEKSINQGAPTMTTSWHFFAVRAVNSFGFGWQWRKQSSKAATTSLPFDFYFDCVSDARGHGYAGPLPPAPKIPVSKTIAVRVPAAGSTKSVMTLIALSRAKARARQAAAG
jgi:hypothetical protein